MSKMKGFEWKEMKRLADLQNKLSVGLKEMEDIVAESLHKNQYTKSEICDILGVNAEELAQTSLSPNTLHGNVLIFKQFDLNGLQLEKFRLGVLI